MEAFGEVGRDAKGNPYIINSDTKARHDWRAGRGEDDEDVSESC